MGEWTRRFGLALLVALAFVPTAARAQSASTGAIAGIVRDATGAVLPGVTVEASSPALIEKSRVAVTDEQGNYKILDLRPGTYAVSFTLTGFSTFKREGIELTTGFTAAANAEMKLGSLEETVTVSGASPVVDVQRAGQQRVLTREVIDTLPTGKTLQGFAALTLGATNISGGQDVGGNRGDGLGGFSVQGGRPMDQRITQEGMLFMGPGGGALMRNIMVNQNFVQETTLQTRGAGTESEAGGAHVNIVPKDGGNTFTAQFTGTGSGSSLQADNSSDELRKRGLTNQPTSRRIWDFGGGLGGRIKRDKLWFYTAHRVWGAQTYWPGSFYNKNQGKYVGDPDSGVTLYEADPNRIPFGNVKNRDHSVRFTLQATPKNKFTISNSYQVNCNCTLGAGPSAPESFRSADYPLIDLIQGTWSSPMTNRLLFEGGATYLYNDYTNRPEKEVSRRDIAIVDLLTGRQYNARASGLWLVDYGVKNMTNQLNMRFATNYVTGSHAMKVGFTWMEAWQEYNVVLNDRPMQYQFRGATPVSLTQWASPFYARSRFSPNLGVFAQDTWTLKRLTFDLGVRYDYLQGTNPSYPSPEGPYVPARQFPEVRDVPNWKDIAPRVGAAWDVFGNGKTAIKGFVGRYVELAYLWGLTYNTNPMAQTAISGNRNWNDANGNYVPDCDLRNNLANGECGQSSVATLGLPVRIVEFGKDVTQGFGNRPSNWQQSVTFQQELRPNVAVQASYYHTSYGNLTLTDNRAVTPADFSPYCITRPTDPRLGSASGQQLCGFYDINPNKLGQNDNLITQGREFGRRTEVYHGMDAGINARFGQGGLLQGGMSTGQTSFNNCVTVDSPQASQPGFCNFKLPFRGQTQYKIAWVYPLPYDVKFSGTYQNLAGVPQSATYVATNAQIAPSLGRNLSSGAGGVAVLTIMEPNTAFEDRLQQVDLRFTKQFRVGGTRIQAMFDVYNAFNANTILGVNGRFGALWLQPTSILAGRLLKFGTQIDF